MLITVNKNNLPSQFFLYLIVLFFGFLPSAFASEGTAPPEKQISYVHYETNLVLEKVIEDTVIISGKKYIYTNQTILNYSDLQRKGIKFSQISSPYLVDLVYRQYAITTEAEPFPPGARIIEKLTLIKKIDPAMLDDYKNRTSQKLN